MRIADAAKFAVTVGASLGAGLVDSLFTVPAIERWYAALAKPMLAPPNWVFGPVWTTLYILMGVAAFLVWREGSDRPAVRAALVLFALQLLLNVLWSYLFFGRQSAGSALVEIVILWLAIAATIIAFKRISRVASWLLAPYLVWVAFAAYLNSQIWILN